MRAFRLALHQPATVGPELDGPVDLAGGLEALDDDHQAALVEASGGPLTVHQGEAAPAWGGGVGVDDDLGGLAGGLPPLDDGEGAGLGAVLAALTLAGALCGVDEAAGSGGASGVVADPGGCGPVVGVVGGRRGRRGRHVCLSFRVARVK